jgi:uncharacterized membrane protein
MSVSATTAPASARLDSIDVVRGFVMVVMLLDHVREWTHAGAFGYNALDPATTTPILYFTRWITHLCAPTFVFLAGLSAGLQALRGRPAGERARLLWTRGLWLVFLELTLVRLVIWFNVDPSMLAFLQVIWAIGASMVLLAAFVRLPQGVVGAVGLAIVVGHNLLDRFQVVTFRGPDTPVPSLPGQLWILAHQGGIYPMAPFPGPMVFAGYPVLPWAGLLFAGYGAAQVYGWSSERRRRALAAAGTAMLAAFALLRYTNLYGDPRPWAPAGSAVKTAMAFFDVAKYPPSLLFVLVTLAPGLLALSWLDGRTPRGWSRALVTFGRVPLFFYFLQWLVAHFAGMLITAAQGKDLSPYFQNLIQVILSGKIPDIGGPLWGTYAVWILGTLLLYPACRWFAGVKARRRDWWLSYL